MKLFDELFVTRYCNSETFLAVERVTLLGLAAMCFATSKAV